MLTEAPKDGGRWMRIYTKAVLCAFVLIYEVTFGYLRRFLGLLERLH